MLASLTGLLLTLVGEEPAIVFIPPLDPELFDWNPDDLSLEFVGEYDGDFAGYSFQANGTQQSMVIFRPVVFLQPSYPSAFGGECVNSKSPVLHRLRGLQSWRQALSLQEFITSLRLILGTQNPVRQG